jgi:O-antigen/teichoic acid export membrane protein
MKDLLKFCLPLVPSTIFWWITGVSDRYLVAAMVSDEENGLYAAAYKIPTLLTYVVTIFNDAWKLSAVSESEDKEKCAEFYSQIYGYYIAVMFVGGGAIAVCSQLAAKILFAESYFTAWIFIPVLSAATVFTALDTFLGSVYFTVKRTQMSLWTSLLGAAVNVVLNFIMIPKLGAMGASIATFASYFLVYIVRAATMGRFMRFKMYHAKLAVNTALIGIIAAIMTLYGNTLFGLLISGGVLLVSAAFNGKDIVIALRQVLSSVKGRRA